MNYRNILERKQKESERSFGQIKKNQVCEIKLKRDREKSDEEF